MVDDVEFFWNLTNGVRPVEPIRGLLAEICESMGHTYDTYYGPLECARCGFREIPAKKLHWWSKW